MTTCTVMMVTSRASQMILASIKSVLRQKGLAELIVVDTGNPPHLLARLQQMTLSEPRLRVIPGAGNVSRATAFNVACEKSTGAYLLLLGVDCLLPPDTLANLMKGLSDESDAMLVGCDLISPDGKKENTVRWRPLTPQAALAEMFRVHVRMVDEEEEDFSHPVMCEYLSGQCLCIRRKDFTTLGGLDDKLVGVWDYDLCLRVRQIGGKVVHIPNVPMIHLLPEKIDKGYYKAQWKEAKGMLRYFKKHYSDDCVPGFLLMLQLVLFARAIVRMLMRRLHDVFFSQSVISHSVAAKRLMVLASGLIQLPENTVWYGRTVMVTGATSQTGLSVVKHLIAEGAAVLAITRGKPIPYYHEHLRWISGDLTDNALDLQGYLIDVVVHCAPLWTLPASRNKLVDAEVKRIVAFGSTSIFGKALSRNRYEKNMVCKLQVAEEDIMRLGKEHNINITILRPTVTYGVGLDLNITSVAKIIDRYGLFFAYPPASGRRQPVHVDDLARAVILAMDKPETHGKSYNISGGEVLTYMQMLERIFEVCEKKVRIIRTTLLPLMLSLAGFITRSKHINSEIAHRMNEDLIFFHDDAKKDFAFEARPFLSRGLKDIEGF